MAPPFFVRGGGEDGIEAGGRGRDAKDATVRGALFVEVREEAIMLLLLLVLLRTQRRCWVTPRGVDDDKMSTKEKNDRRTKKKRARQSFRCESSAKGSRKIGSRKKNSFFSHLPFFSAFSFFSFPFSPRAPTPAKTTLSFSWSFFSTNRHLEIKRRQVTPVGEC